MHTPREIETGLVVPGAPVRRRIAATPSRLAQTIRIQADAIRLHAADILRDLNPNAVHDLRVACRRLSATLKSFESAAGGSLARHARRRAARLTRDMGEVRDFDVFLAAIQTRAAALPPAHQNALALPLARWRRQRRRLHARLAATLQASPFTALLRALQTLARRLETMAATAESSAGGIAARARVRRLLKRVRRLGRSIDRDTPDTTLHRLRIRCKKLRYACECLGAVCGDATAGFVEEATRLQRVLGHHQDLSVEAKRLRNAMEGPTAKRTPALRNALKVLLARVSVEQKRSHRASLKAWRRLDRHPSCRGVGQRTPLSL